MPTFASLSRPARRLPSSAPSVLAISSRSARLTSALRPGREMLATAADVAMTPIRLAPTATRIGSPNRRVSAGTKKMPPPNPSIAPNIPATIPMPANAKNGQPHRRAIRVHRMFYGGGRRGMLEVIPVRHAKMRHGHTRRRPLIKRWYAHRRSVPDQIMPDIISPSHAMHPADRPPPRHPLRQSAPIDHRQHDRPYHQHEADDRHIPEDDDAASRVDDPQTQDNHSLSADQQPGSATQDDESCNPARPGRSELMSDRPGSPHRRSSRRRSHCLSAASASGCDAANQPSNWSVVQPNTSTSTAAGKADAPSVKPSHTTHPWQGCARQSADQRLERTCWLHPGNRASINCRQYSTGQQRLANHPTLTRTFSQGDYCLFCIPRLASAAAWSIIRPVASLIAAVIRGLKRQSGRRAERNRRR